MEKEIAKSFEKRREKAEQAIEKSREAESPEEAVALFREGLDIYEALAKEGDVESYLRLGDLYEEIDRYEDSLKAYEKAAEKGSSRGQYDYWGVASEYFHYDEEILKKGFAYLLKAVDSGHPFASYDLASAYEEGIGVEPDMEKAILFYEKATEGEEGGFAAFRLGEIYWLGELVEKDKEKAFHWFDVAVNKGYIDKEEIKDIIAAEEGSPEA